MMKRIVRGYVPPVENGEADLEMTDLDREMRRMIALKDGTGVKNEVMIMKYISLGSH